MTENITAQERVKANRKGKDSVFTHLFSEPEYRFQLFRALHPEMTKVAPEDIIPLTITNVMIDRPYNDLAFLVGKTLLILVEAQAKWSINILIRLLMYLAQTYSDYINDHKLDLYGTKALPLPEPEFFVIFTGRRKKQPVEINFSEEFFGGRKTAVDITAKVIYDGEHGDIISQYVTFCHVLDAQFRKFGRTARAARETIEICKDQNVLKKYLEEREKEVIDIMTLLFDQETAMKNHMAAVTRELTEKITKKVTREVTRDVTEAVTRDVTKAVTRDVKKKTTLSVTVDALKNLMQNMKWPAAKAMAALGIPKEQQADYAALLQA